MVVERTEKDLTLRYSEIKRQTRKFHFQENTLSRHFPPGPLQQNAVFGSAGHAPEDGLTAN